MFIAAVETAAAALRLHLTFKTTICEENSGKIIESERMKAFYFSLPIFFCHNFLLFSLFCIKTQRISSPK
jgi:hypothetical protein